mmetsp:Transcript_26694/g.52126  ORF Transcript_26694/g.52126 Transcript_26694/m.52126 type:complete len:346 (-) Transcript_26694:364-1401(-)|eukprot:CAMPEP_0167789410 /NCGR_PEP_ID=MMETSP0111_2-20121227/10669_1 /TAXON_ID=91324 /ORGANISM="Lotharella globosa, Strain CCCM811" /LENGTH=345 /DNA_ID=CAMNT_0007681573 /DNA_START=149 /DNA_END=1186 /DNA_ORIENTATION=+
MSSAAEPKAKAVEPSCGCFRVMARIGTLLKYDEAKHFLDLLAVVYSLFIIATILLAFSPSNTDLQDADQRYLDVVLADGTTPDSFYTDSSLVFNDDYPSNQFYRWSEYNGRRMTTNRVGSLAAEGQNGYGTWSTIFRNKQERPERSSVVQLPSFRLFWYSMQTVAMFVGGLIAIIWIRFMNLFLAGALQDRAQVKGEPGGPRHLTFASWFSLVFEVIVFALALFSAFAFLFFTELLRVAVQIQSPRVNADALVTEYLQILSTLAVVPVFIVMIWGIVSIVCGCCFGWVCYAPQSPWEMTVPEEYEVERKKKSIAVEIESGGAGGGAQGGKDVKLEEMKTGGVTVA